MLFTFANFCTALWVCEDRSGGLLCEKGAKDNNPISEVTNR